jgi:hypothetical protein
MGQPWDGRQWGRDHGGRGHSGGGSLGAGKRPWDGHAGRGGQGPRLERRTTAAAAAKTAMSGGGGDTSAVVARDPRAWCEWGQRRGDAPPHGDMCVWGERQCATSRECVVGGKA